jgi:hypothetical protein
MGKCGTVTKGKVWFAWRAYDVIPLGMKTLDGQSMIRFAQALYTISKATYVERELIDCN